MGQRSKQRNLNPWRKRTAKDKRQSRRSLFEFLEPRVVLDADPVNVIAHLYGNSESTSNVPFQISADEFTSSRGTRHPDDTTPPLIQIAIVSDRGLSDSDRITYDSDGLTYQLLSGPSGVWVDPVSGIPITVARSRDSLISHQSDELGCGWSLEFVDTDLQTSVPKTGLVDHLVDNPFL